MGWFNDQIKERINNDEKSFEISFIDLSSVVLGKFSIIKAINNDRLKTQTAIDEILKYYKINPVKVPDKIEDMNERIEFVLRPTGIMRRTVNLDGKWWKSAIGPMLGQTIHGDTVALIPNKISGYSFFDYKSSKKLKVNSKTAKLLEREAFCFYKPFPLKKVKIRDLALYILNTLEKSDFVAILLITLFGKLIGMLSPYINKLLFSKVVPSNNQSLLIPFATLLIGSSISISLIGILSSLIASKIQTKIALSVEGASMNRLLLLPATFFKNYNSGELASRVGGLQKMCMEITKILLGNALAALFSFVYLFQMNIYAPQLSIPGLIFIFVQLAFVILSTFLTLKISRKRMLAGTKVHGLVISLFSGIQKIKLCGAERRAFSRWEKTYKDSAELSYNPPTFIKVIPIFSTIINLIGTTVLYYIAGSTFIKQADYVAFNTAFGALSGAIMSLAGLTDSFASLKPLLELSKPILDTEPELSENKKLVTNLSGMIEINNVTFRYREHTPNILNNLTLKITPGQYIAIVGKTGCGKSTLMRLLLGFEKPQKGAIYYDGVDVNKIDLRSMRKKIGSVMQDGKLFQDDIYSNIVISAPWLSLDDAWKAASLAGLADDINEMPMGMHTIISEGSGGISGGQKQRLMIARAVAPNPSILMFDEATSALDNITQKKISDALDKLHSTRIVIAHRLSTIKNCDRIIVLDGGKIIEDGTYNELIEQKGYFYELVKRQQLGEKI